MKTKHIYPLLFLGIILLFQACEIQISDNRRILVKGNIVDSFNNPISNISVRCGVNGEILGETFSDANGQFQFTSLEADDAYPLDILVNLESKNNGWGGNYNSELIGNPDYSAKHYCNNFINRESSSYDLGQIILKDPARLILFINNIPGDTNTLSFKLEYEPAICKIDLNSNNLESCWVSDDEYRNLSENYSNIQIGVDSQLGTSVIFKYILNNDPVQSISIPLTNKENTYVFEY